MRLYGHPVYISHLYEISNLRAVLRKTISEQICAQVITCILFMAVDIKMRLSNENLT